MLDELIINYLGVRKMSIETKINNIVGKLTLDDDFVGQGANAKI